MSRDAYRVRVVLDPDFGERLAELPDREPVWVVNSEANAPTAKRLQAERATTHLYGVTIFWPFSDGGPEQHLLDILDAVDLHHGKYSADPPYSEVEVYGVGLSQAVERAFRDMGFTLFHATPDGFVASRPTAS
jgi:hypothetical protein